ncbi:MAG: hypothetical protein HY259_00890 [Chloroflexi bacterium]|nr:hypothetical protein [Chloroflexota bacterium]MBI3732005.1 hypothetical protein [Chloroflexota bacterium]
MAATVYPNWRDTVRFSADGPQPQVLLESDKVKVVLVGLEAGQRLPLHPAPGAAYHILEGSGWFLLNAERIAVKAGATVVAADGDRRGFEAETRLAFLGARGV